MRHRRTAGTASAATALAVALTAGLITSSSATAETPSAGGGPARQYTWGGQDGSSVTLITGDRVLLDGDGKVRGVIRAEGREDVPMQIISTKKHTYVLPQDVTRLIRERKLDRRLFDVTELSRAEYRERAGDGVPFIVTYRGGSPAARAELHAEADPEVRATLESVNGEALTVTEEGATDAWTALTRPSGAPGQLAAVSGVATVSLDGIKRALLDRGPAQIGAPAAWQAGYDGKGVTVAVVDTGVDATHPDLKGKVLKEKNFSTTAVDARDHHGHGTHVASTAAGTGAKSGGKYKGVAPGAKLISAKVLDDDGYGSDSEIIAGLEWAVEQGAEIVNVSLGDTDTAAVDPMEAAVNRLSERHDVLFVVAAGNSGEFGPVTIGNPASAEAALTVGAVDKQGGLAEFSSTGPLPGAGTVKPDLTAPGVDIGAAAAKGSTVEREGIPVADGYVAISGTSMATPHVAGAAALLAQQHPDWSGQRIKAALTASAKPGAYSPFQQGTGQADLVRAMKQTVFAEPVSLNFGLAQWPHGDDEPVTEPLTYRNTGTEDVTLALTAAGTRPDGRAAPAGMFTLAADRVTVPAGGTAAVGVTADTRLGGSVNGGYAVTVTATGGGQTVRSTGAVHREAEHYILTVRHLGRDGKPTGSWEGNVTSYEGFLGEPVGLPHSETGTSTIRLPKGSYAVSSDILTLDAAGKKTRGQDWLLAPRLQLTKDTTLTFDARKAKPITMTVPDGKARQTDVNLSFLGVSADEDEGAYVVEKSAPGLPAGFRTAQVGGVAGLETAESAAGTRWANGSTEYHTFHSRTGGFYTGLTQKNAKSDMARITVRTGSAAAGRRGELAPVPAGGEWFAGKKRTFPATTTMYVRAKERTAVWGLEYYQYAPDGAIEGGYYTDERGYTAGKSYTHTLNNGVFGPCLGGDGGIHRDGDNLYGEDYPFADGSCNIGGTEYDSARTTLYRNGKKHESVDGPLHDMGFTLPKGKAEYKLVTTVSRSKASRLSTKVSSSYTFTSARPGGTTALPVSAVRYTPTLNLDGTSKAKTGKSVPVTLQGTAAKNRKNLEYLNFYVSYDSGKTWKKLTLKNDKLTVKNPAKGKGVSFKVNLRDKKGNALSQTIINAYRTR